MAAVELLAPGDTAAASAVIVVEDGAAATIGIKAAPSPCELSIAIQADDASWTTIGKVTSAMPVCIQAPGTYRVARAAGVQCGAYRA